MRPTESFDRKNVTELGLEVEDQPELRFDPKRDLTPDDWMVVPTHLSAQRTFFTSESKYLPLATAVRELDPNFDLGLEESGKEDLILQLKSFRTHRQWVAYARHAAGIRQLWPDANLQLKKTDLNGLRKAREQFQHLSLSIFLPLSADVKVLDPSFDLGLTATDWETFRSELDLMRRAGLWQTFAKEAVAVLELDPSYDLRLSAGDWEAMRAELDLIRQTNRGAIYEYAANLNKLAKKIPHETSISSHPIPPVPETKAYYE